MIHHITHFFKKVGYGLGSSRWLARSLVKHARIRDHGNIRILELGAGKGNVTREILSHLGNNVSLTAIEYDIDRVEILRHIVHPHIEIIHGNVENLEDYCEHGSIDIVISTLPLGSFDPVVVEKVLGNIKNVLRK